MTRLPAIALVVLLAAGCSDVADRAQQEASDQVRAALRTQICAVVSDGQISGPEVTVLDRVLDRAHNAGVPAEILDAAHTVAAEGKATAKEVTDLSDACRRAG